MRGHDPFIEHGGNIIMSPLRPYRPGAAADLFTGHPLLIVYGTQGSDTRNQALREAAEKTALFQGSWHDMVIGRIPIRADAAVTPDDLSRLQPDRPRRRT